MIIYCPSKASFTLQAANIGTTDLAQVIQLRATTHATIQQIAMTQPTTARTLSLALARQIPTRAARTRRLATTRQMVPAAMARDQTAVQTISVALSDLKVSHDINIRLP